MPESVDRAGGPSATTSGPEPGYLTTEFWVTVVTLVLSILTMVFHRDFSVYIQPIAVGAAAVTVVGYQLTRGLRKSAVAKAQVTAAAVMCTYSSAPAHTVPGSTITPIFLTKSSAANGDATESTDRWVLLGRG